MDWNFTEVFEEYSGSGGEQLGSFWEAFGKQLGSVRGRARLLLMLERCRSLCMEDDWNFWKVFEEHFERWGAIGECLGSL